VWFEKYRKSDRAWDDLFAVLGGGVPIDAAAKDAVNLLAAQTLCFKVSRGPLLPEPRIPRLEGQKSHHTEPTERHRSTVFGQSVLQRLMSFTVTAAATSSTTGAPANKALLTQLCLALVSAVVRWEGVVEFDAGFQSVMDTLVPVGGGFAALLFLTLLPERAQASKSIGLAPSRKAVLKQAMQTKFPAVHGILASTIQKNPHLALQVFECCNAWLETNCVDSGALLSSPLIEASSAFLGRHGMAAGTALGTMIANLSSENLLRLCSAAKDFFITAATLSYLGETPTQLENGPCRKLAKNGACEFMHACRFSHVLGHQRRTSLTGGSSGAADTGGGGGRRKAAREQRATAKIFSPVSLPSQPIQCPALLSAMFDELRHLATAGASMAAAGTGSVQMDSAAPATIVCRALATTFCEISCNLMGWFFSTPEQFGLMGHLISCNVVFVGHSHHSVVECILPFWRHFVTRLASSSSSADEVSISRVPAGAPTARVQESLVAMTRALVHAAGYPTQYEHMDPGDREHFFDFFRNDVRDMLRHIVGKIPSIADTVFAVTVEAAEQGAASGAWQKIEAGAHAMSAVCRWTPPRHAGVARLLQLVMDDARVRPMHSHAGLRCTIALLLGQLAPWIAQSNPALLRTAIQFIVVSLSFPREHDVFKMKVGQDHCAVVAFDKICDAGADTIAQMETGSGAGRTFTELAGASVWGQMLQGVGTKQEALSDRDRHWFLGGLAKLASRMCATVPGPGGVGHQSTALLAARMLLDPLSSAASEEVLNDPGKRTIRDFIAEAVARMLQNFQPVGKETELVALVEGYSDLLRRLLRPRDKDFDDKCHATICDGLASVHERCSSSFGSRVLGCVGDALLVCLRGPRPMACHVQLLRHCLVSLVAKAGVVNTAVTATTEELARARDSKRGDPNSTHRPAFAVAGASIVGASSAHGMSAVVVNSDAHQANYAVHQKNMALLIGQATEASLSFLNRCGPLGDHPDLVAALFVLLRDSCRHVTELFMTMWQGGPILQFTVAGMTMQKRECGRAVLGFIEVLTKCHLLDATSGPIIVHAMVAAAAGKMPSFMLEPISDSLQAMIRSIGADTMQAWLMQAVSPAGFPSRSMKDKTKTLFVQEFVAADTRSTHKRVLKAFAGGKRKGEVGAGYKNGRKQGKK
jgi:hypothetical protein